MNPRMTERLIAQLVETRSDNTRANVLEELRRLILSGGAPPGAQIARTVVVNPDGSATTSSPGRITPPASVPVGMSGIGVHGDPTLFRFVGDAPPAVDVQPVTTLLWWIPKALQA